MNFFDGTGEVDGREGVGWTVDSTKLILMSKRKVKVESTCRPAKKKKQSVAEIPKGAKRMWLHHADVEEIGSRFTFFALFFVLFVCCMLFVWYACLRYAATTASFVCFAFFFLLRVCWLIVCLF